MRCLRKNTIFRVYLLVMCVSFAVAGFGALSGQRRYYSSRLSAMEDRLSALVVAVADATNRVVESVSVSSSEVQDQRRSSEELFWVEGHGTNRKWAYLDICFPDGYRARYYFRPWPSRQELIALHRRISHDSLIHAIPLDYQDDFSIIWPHVRSLQDSCYCFASWHGWCFGVGSRACSGLVSSST